ncbi:MAG: DNA methyltransferase [Candidatus Gracilibacteria bacterium]|jgi:DNA modification methylase|nr:DNA methyltransferase [Candidatus Gracilibacteria bacterium]
MNKNINIAYVPVNSLKPAEYNPRKWDEKAEASLTESLSQFGLIDPFIVNKAKGRENILIGGHFRWHVAKKLNFKEVPVVFVNIPDLAKEKELNLRLNRNTGEWNFKLLAEFDIELLLDVGFDDSDLSIIWDESLGLEEDEFDVQKELEEIEEPRTKDGEMFQLGNHFLVCGDSTDPETVKRLVGDNKINTIYSDPPYNISYDYQKGLGEKDKYKCGEVDDKLTQSEYRKFLEATLLSGLKHCEPNAHIFYWCDQKYIGVLQDVYRQHGIDNKRVCLWIKNNQNTTPQVAFNKCFEPCVYGTIGKPYLSDKSLNFTEILNPEIDTGNRTIDDIMDLLDIWMVKRLPTSEYLHPTQKPVTLHEKPLKRCTKVGDHVLDMFGGSGSTLIACEQLGRKVFLVEKDPRFCDVIIQRYLALNPKNHVKKCN